MAVSELVQNYWQRYTRLNPWFVMSCYMAVMVLWGMLFLEPQDSRWLLALTVIPIGVIADTLLHRIQTGRRNLESSFITSAIVTVLLPSDVPLWFALAAILLAIGSKHFILHRGRHLFNPAGFGVAVMTLFFGYNVGWWPDSYVWVAVFLGLLNVARVRKFPQIASFCAVYIVLLTMFVGFPSGSLRFEDLSLQTLPLDLPWFFALFMLPEPVTSPQPRTQQIVFGAIVAGVGFAASYVDFFRLAALIWGLLAANLYVHALKLRASRQSPPPEAPAPQST